MPRQQNTQKGCLTQIFYAIYITLHVHGVLHGCPWPHPTTRSMIDHPDLLPYRAGASTPRPECANATAMRITLATKPIW